MVKSFKKYFSFFGILNATASAKINSLLTSLSYLVKIDIPKIMKKLHVSQLKPIKLYSTNKCNTQGKN